MKEQQLDLDNINCQLSNKNIIIPIFMGVIMFFYSCERGSIEKINQLTRDINAPTLAYEDTEIIYSEKGQINTKIISPEVNRYETVENPYMEFPKGLYVEFFDSLQKPSSSIKANYCIYDENTKIWTAENDVVSINTDGDTLNTDYLVWDQNTRKIYSDRYVRITNSDGIIHGKGFEANEDLSNWSIKQTSGTISVENEK